MGERLEQLDGEMSECCVLRESLYGKKMAELPVSHEMTLEHMKERKGSA